MAVRRKSVRIVDIAREAGVANSVVSSLFSGKYYGKSKGAVVGIGEETKKRIWKSCRKLGYRPTDPILEMEIYPEQADVIFMLNRRSGGFNNAFYSLILDGVGQEAEVHSVNLNLGRFMSEIDYLVEPDKVPLAAQKYPSGKYIMAGIPNYSLILSLVRSGAKIVYVSRHIEIPGVMSLTPDYAAAAKLAVQHLIELGHRKIVAFASEHFRNQGYSLKELVRGFSEAMALIDVEYSLEDVVFSGHGPENTENIVKGLLSREDAPTAAFCFDDATATYLMKHLTNLGVQVPDDFSVVGCNDDKSGPSHQLSLTTVRFPMYEIGRRAFESVTHAAVHGGPEEDQLEVWPVELVERSSATKLS